MRAISASLVAASVLLLGCDEGGVDCSVGGSGCAESAPSYGVKVNSAGYLPGRAKRATLAGAAGFQVLRADGSVAFEGVAGEPVAAPDSGETVRIADFSALEEEGSFRLATEDGAQSPPFTIGSAVFLEP